MLRATEDDHSFWGGYLVEAYVEDACSSALPRREEKGCMIITE